MSEPVIFNPHSSKQEKAILSNKKILLLGTGTQWGKTSVGAIRMKMKLHTFTNKNDAFIITSPNYKTMYQSTLPPFLKLMEGYGEHSKKEEAFRMHNGGTVYFRTETDPDSIVGITNVRHIWGDEAGKYRLYFWENMQARADFYGCGIDLTTSPYSLNWVFKELIKPVQKGLRDDVDIIQASSWENPYHSLAKPENLALKRATMDSRRFNMIYGGKWDKMEGLVYDCWDDDENLVQAFELPVGTKYIAGVDWGYNPDPFALKVRAITPDGRHYGVSEFVKTRLTITDIVQVAKQKKSVFPIQVFYCDPSQPGYIEEFNRNGLPAIGADNDIRRGVDLHYELIKTRRYKEFIGACPYSADEREVYHYPELKDLGPDDNSKEQLPADQNNHTQDADRYITIMTYRSGGKAEVKLPGEKPKQETIEQRLARLRRGKHTTHTESWS